MLRRVMLERKTMQGADRGWWRGAILDKVAFLLHRCGCSRGAPCRLTKGSLTPQHAFFPNRTGSLSAMDTAMDSVHRFGKHVRFVWDSGKDTPSLLGMHIPVIVVNTQTLWWTPRQREWDLPLLPAFLYILYENLIIDFSTKGYGQHLCNLCGIIF